MHTILQPEGWAKPVGYAEYVGNLKGIGEAYRALIGRHFPAMAAMQVVALVEDRAKVEIQATAVIPD
ncbi:MAG: hypothetical protein E5V96_20435 [Mesorhizobium sp.]|nr:MAG: hypothetical protein E5V96_20435 [Mesorhizobium sp.]